MVGSIPAQEPLVTRNPSLSIVGAQTEIRQNGSIQSHSLRWESLKVCGGRMPFTCE